MNRVSAENQLSTEVLRPEIGRQERKRAPQVSAADDGRSLRVSILTGGRDPYYALGLLSGLRSFPLRIDFLADDAMRSAPEARAANVRYWSLRRDHAAGTTAWRRVLGVLGHYVALCRYAVASDSPVFHILWFTRFEWFDNTFMIAFYKLLRKRLVLTVHNVNRKQRDGKDGFLNRLSLRFLYRQVDHLFVHTERMRGQLQRDFAVPEDRVSIIPFGVISLLVKTDLNRAAARERLGLSAADKVLLFFGNIAPYKGLDVLVDSLAALPDCRLIIAGPVKTGCEAHWRGIESTIAAKGLAGRIVNRVCFIPEEDVEVYFKAADALVLPYRTICQSAVLFLGLQFGLPVIATDVGELAGSVKQCVNGFVSRPGDPDALAATIDEYFASPLFEELEARRPDIISDVYRTHSWATVAEQTSRVYAKVAGLIPASLERAL